MTFVGRRRSIKGCDGEVFRVFLFDLIETWVETNFTLKFGDELNLSGECREV
jgi:hypothetical protein